MKKIIVFIVFFSFVSIASSEYLYVTDSFEITLRTGRGLQHKILGMLPSGEKLEILNVEEQWTNVKRKNGQEGWVLSRFLKNDIPKAIKLKLLTGKYNLIKEEQSKNISELKALRADNSSLKSDLKAIKAQFRELSENYSRLQNESAGYLNLKKKYEKNVKILEENQKKSKELENTLMERNIKLFVAGAVVLILGFIIGISSKKKRGSRYSL